VPCFKLGLRLGPAIVQQFHQSQRNGFYVRVLERGEVAAGDTVAIMQRDPGGISIAQLYRARFFQPDPMLLRRAAEHPATSTEWRGELLEGLD
ncbi:MAG: MOSC domain-containing protein, partial [Planctomycetales bacterium]|nr:MOSC domain-containing protein [Planctomycetales bacterium]